MTSEVKIVEMTDDERAALHWEALANEQPDTQVGRNKAALYRSAAKSIRLTESTGVFHCACCFKPQGAGIRLH